MKKRTLILAGLVLTAQIFAAAPALAEGPDPAVLEQAEAEEEMTDEEIAEELNAIIPPKEEEETAVKKRPEYDYKEYIKELGNYKGLEVEVEALQEVTEEMIQNEIDVRLENNKEVLTEGTVQLGDVANIDYCGKKDGVAFQGGTAQGSDLGIGSGQFIDGFEDGLIGVKIGDTVDLNLTFPEGYPAADLAGADVVFTVTVNSVQRTAELTDDLAKELSDGKCKDVEAYRNSVRIDIENNLKDAQKSEAENAFWQMILEDTVIENLPEEVVDYDTNANMDYYRNMVQMYYGTSLESYCSMQGMSVEDFESNIRRNMEATIRYQILERAIVDAEGVTFEPEDFLSYAETYAGEYGYELEVFLDIVEEEEIWNYIYYDKAAEILLANNTFTEKTK